LRSPAIADRSPLRRPVTGSTVATNLAAGSSPLKRRSDDVSGASSEVAIKKRSGSDSLAMVRHVLRY
jgi:hypothetical protein